MPFDGTHFTKPEDEPEPQSFRAHKPDLKIGIIAISTAVFSLAAAIVLVALG